MFSLRPYQNEAVDSVISYYTNGGKENIVAALPTGTGKAVCIAELIMRLLSQWSFMRVIMATHVAELVAQNAEKLMGHWPIAPVGIYNAELRRKDTSQPIIFGSIQSMIGAVDKLGHRDVLIVDEAHLIGKNKNSQYLKFIEGLKAKNPHLVVIGWTATPYRVGMGMITDGPIFNLLRYDLTGVEPFNRLIQAGYLAPLIPQPTDNTLNVDGVKIQNGDFVGSQLQDAVDQDQITYAAMSEMCEKAANRRSWLVFTAGVDHAESAALALRQMGIDAQTMHSKLPKAERSERIKSFKNDSIRCLVTNNMLTTGFDHPPVDAIGVLRPTMSPGLWVQILGRGTRPSEGKNNCLILDFAKNTPRLGPINDPRIPNKPGKPTGEIPVKICPSCGIYNHAGARYCGGGSSPEEAKICGGCAFEFVFETKYYQVSGTEDVVRKNEDIEPKINTYSVNHVWYSKHEKGNKSTLKVTYACGVKSFKEFVPLEHFGQPRDKAIQWWGERHHSIPPIKVEDALMMQNDLRIPFTITVDETHKYPTIVSHRFE